MLKSHTASRLRCYNLYVQTVKGDMSEFTEQIPHEVTIGLDAFNKREFFAAHENFEDAWRKTPGYSREFYRALLHLSGGFFRLTQVRPAAAQKFFTHALKWLAFFTSPYRGFKTDELIYFLQKISEAIIQETPCDVILSDHFEPIRSILDMRTP